MDTPQRPIFLLADSQLLFLHAAGAGLSAQLLEAVEPAARDGSPKAAYLGASNGDAPEFYELFVAAMDGFGIRDCRMIPAAPSPDDWAYLAEADLILLAGGDTRRGWASFREHGVVERIVERYYAGAVLIGVSAGAVQLGQRGWSGAATTSDDLFPTFQLVPYLVDVHDEPEWRSLRRAVGLMGAPARGIGIPSGGGAIFHPDYSIEPVRHALAEIAADGDRIRQALLMPPGDAAAGIEER